MSLEGLTEYLASFASLIRKLGPYGLCAAILTSCVLRGIPITPILVVEAAVAAAIGHIILQVASYVGSKIEAKTKEVRN